MHVTREQVELKLSKDLHEIAGELERLSEEIIRYYEALELIAGGTIGFEQCVNLARDAIGPGSAEPVFRVIKSEANTD